METQRKDVRNLQQLRTGQRYRNRQVEEVSNRLAEDGNSKFEKPRRKKVKAG